VGDIINLETGMKIPGDCLVIDGTDLAADESALTGECEKVDK
jgi:magnesium-transporting ATPase (P-type)